jgi:hypothetical protein
MVASLTGGRQQLRRCHQAQVEHHQAPASRPLHVHIRQVM